MLACVCDKFLQWNSVYLSFRFYNWGTTACDTYLNSVPRNIFLTFLG